MQKTFAFTNGFKSNLAAARGISHVINDCQNLFKQWEYGMEERI